MSAALAFLVCGSAAAIAFANALQLGGGGLVVGNDPFFTTRSEQLAALALRHAVPTIFQYREFVEAGGLMSYGGNLTDSYRLTGVYTGRKRAQA